MFVFLKAASLTISVKLPDNKPAKGVDVWVQQLVDAYKISSSLLGKTDKKGQINVEFGRGQIKKGGLGLGMYRFIVMPKSFRWEASDYYCWMELECGTDEGPFSPLKKVEPDAGYKWDVKLKKGADANVIFTDQAGKPAAFCTVFYGLESYASSGTGYGGGITMGREKTGKDGSFTLKNAGDFDYRFVVDDAGYYVPDEKFWKREFTAKLKDGDNKFLLKKVVGSEITIRVRDQENQMPVKGAKFCYHLSVPAGGEVICMGLTSKDGIYYTYNFNPDHVSQFGVMKTGYYDEWLDGDSYTPGGNYEFELKKKE